MKRRQAVIPVPIEGVLEWTDTQVTVDLGHGKHWRLALSEIDFSPTGAAIIMPEWLYDKYTKGDQRN
jgi:hypothetical protein